MSNRTMPGLLNCLLYLFGYLFAITFRRSEQFVFIGLVLLLVVLFWRLRCGTAMIVQTLVFGMVMTFAVAYAIKEYKMVSFANCTIAVVPIWLLPTFCIIALLAREAVVA